MPASAVITSNMFVPLRATHQQVGRSHLARRLLTRSPTRLGREISPPLVACRQPLRFASEQARPSDAVASTSLPKPTYTLPTKGILSKLPPSWVPFAELSRIEKPGGLYGFYMAYLIGLGYGACLVTPTVQPAHLAQIAGVLLVYNVFLRGAACTVNDILDRDYDRQVARCKNRPIARRAVTPTQGYFWYAAQTVGAGAAIACLPSPMLALAYAGWSCRRRRNAVLGASG
jgi:hypothetical protein